MLVYKSAYFETDDEWIVGEVLDFPGVLSQGHGLDEARRMLASALVDMAETLLMDGQPLPVPDPTATNGTSMLEEPIYLVLDAGSHVRTVVERATL